MYHLFDADIAKEYGVNEAIILYNIAFWVDTNRKNERNLFDGRYWTYNSAKAFQEQFPYMSVRTIQRVIKNLIDNGLILSGKFSSDSRNRTNYYTLTDYGASITIDWRVALRQSGNTAYDKSAECLFNNNTDSITDINNADINNISCAISRKADELDSMFEQFWEAYPQCFRKANKKGCKAKFVKIKNLQAIFPQIMYSLDVQKRSKQWNEQDGRFIPAPLTWINQERWTITDTRTERQVTSDNVLGSRLDRYTN